MAILFEHQSEYQSDLLTKEDREKLNSEARQVNRTAFYSMTTEEVTKCNEWTLEQLVYGVVRLDWKEVVDRLGLVVSEAEKEPKLDEDGSPMLDEDGEPILIEITPPDGRFSCKVIASGLEDYRGNPIKPSKSKVMFDCVKQPTNRPLNETNYKHLIDRLSKWAMNGETLIKDAQGNGQSEQHRCTAIAVQILEGKMPPDEGILSFFVSGIHPNIAITIDTGKANTGKDIFGSNPEICSNGTLKTSQCWAGATETTELMPSQIANRKAVCGIVEGAAKLLALRLSGNNIKTGVKGGTHKATELALKLATSVFPNLDEVAAVVHAFNSVDIPPSSRIASSRDLVVAYCLWELRDEECIATQDLPRNVLEGTETGRDLSEVTVKFDTAPIIELMRELTLLPHDGRLASWATRRLRGGAEEDVDKFGKLLKMVKTFFSGEEVTAELYNKEAIGGKQTTNKYYHFGGADRGPVAKKQKAS